jgi:hypothetical protein
VIGEQDFTDPELLTRRRRDHERVDSILTTRVAPEDRELGGPRTLVDRLMTPANRFSSRRLAPASSVADLRAPGSNW